MARPPQKPKRQRGSIRRLTSGSLQVRVYAGVDPVTKKDLYLTEVVPVGPRQDAEAEKARTRLLNQVDEKRNPKTRATVDQLMVKYFNVLDVDTLTKRNYRSKYNNHIKPLLGTTQLTRLDTEILDSFYAIYADAGTTAEGRSTFSTEPHCFIGVTNTKETGAPATIRRAAGDAAACANHTSAKASAIRLSGRSTGFLAGLWTEQSCGSGSPSTPPSIAKGAARYSVPSWVGRDTVWRRTLEAPG